MNLNKSIENVVVQINENKTKRIRTFDTLDDLLFFFLPFYFLFGFIPKFTYYFIFINYFHFYPFSLRHLALFFWKHSVILLFQVPFQPFLHSLTKVSQIFPPSIFPLVKFELISCYYYHIECGSEYRRAIWRTMLKSNKRAFCQQKNLKKTLKIYFVLVIISGASKTNPVKWKDHHL